jgi:hypothetical protein
LNNTMADNSVFISGIAEGALESELSKLPKWATEATTADIRGLLTKTYALQAKAFAELIKKNAAGGGLSPEEMADFNKHIKDANKGLKKQEDSEEKWIKKTEAERKKQEKRRQADGTYFDKKKYIEDAILVIQLAVLETYKKNFAAFRDLNEAGINLVAGFDSVRDGFDGVAQLTALSGVRFTELSASMQKYATAINAFGAGKFAKTVGQASGNLAKFGFSSKEAADLLGSYLDSQSNFTNIQNRTQAETTQDLEKFGERIMKLSIATGQSRTAILANLKAVSDSTEASVLQGQVGTDAAESTLEFVSSLKNQQFGKQLLKMMTDQIKPLNQTFQSFQKIGQGGFAQKMTAFTQSLKGMDPAEQAQALKSFEEANHAEIEHNKQLANLYSQVPELAGEANAALESYKGLQQSANAVTRISAEELEKLKKTNQARAGFNTEYEKLMSRFQSIFSLSIPAMDALTNGIKILNGGIDLIIGAFKKFDEYVLIPLTSNMGKFGEYIGGIGSLDWAGFLVAGIAMIKGAKWFGTSMIDVIKGFRGKGADKAEDLLGGGSGKKRGKGGKGSGGGLFEGIGKGFEGLGKGIAGLGKGIGGAIGGLLTGLADGLAALGKPQVLLGVLALAGIGGALWVAGKALQEFTQISWETLAKAGVTLVALAAAGAALGSPIVAGLMLSGALAIAALGASLWVVGKAIDAVGGGITTISTGLSSLSDTLGAFKGLDTLKTLVSTVNELEISKALALAALSAVGLKSPASASDVTSPSTPEPSTLSTPSQVSSPTTPKPSTLSTPSQVSSAPDGDGKQAVAKNPTSASAPGTEKPATADDVSTAISYQSSLLQQLLETMNSMLSVNKDMLKYAKVNS